jgi:hypothetical protein
MLYDNAQLARVYLHAYQLTQKPFFEKICRQILTYLEREMLDASGGFYSTQDADSEGEEGKFFLWSAAECRALLRDHLTEDVITAILEYWDITPSGNFEGKNIVHISAYALDVAARYQLEVDEFLDHLEKARQLLFAQRETRLKPSRDEKMLAAWNGMALAAFAEAGRVLDEAHYTTLAVKNAEFLLAALSRPDGRLYRTHKGGASKLNAYLEDYANVIDGLLEVYQSTFDPRWFGEAQRLSDHVLDHFRAEDGIGFYDTSDDHEKLVARPRGLQDNATPSGNSLMAYNLIRLGAYTGDPRYETAALSVLKPLAGALRQYPSAFGMALSALFLLVKRPIEVALIGEKSAAAPLLAVIQKPFRPRVITTYSPQDQGAAAQPPLLAQRSQREAMPTVYVCQNFACAAPVNSLQEVELLLK